MTGGRPVMPGASYRWVSTVRRRSRPMSRAWPPRRSRARGGSAAGPMLDPNELIGHWGYSAIFLAVVLGNVGMPVPEEAILALAGYLVWRGKLRLPLVLAVGIASAAAGDNLGY